MATSTKVALATVTLGSAASSIDFTGISGAYTNLKIVFTGTCVSASRYLTMRFNSDSGSNYSMNYLAGDGSSAIASNRTSDTYLYTNNYNGTSTTIPQTITSDILNYSGGTYKAVLCATSNDQNGSGAVDRVIGLWSSTAVITSVSLYYQASANIAAGSTATIYGIL